MNSVIAFWWLLHRSISHLASLYHLEVFSDANAANFSFLYRHHCGLLSTAILLLPQHKLLFTSGGAKGGTGLSIFQTMKTSVFLANAQSRFASVILNRVLGPPRLARHTCGCTCISVVEVVMFDVRLSALD